MEVDAPEGRSAGDVTRVLGPEGGLQSSASVADAADLSMQTPAPTGTVLADTPPLSEVRDRHMSFVRVVRGSRQGQTDGPHQTQALTTICWTQQCFAAARSGTRHICSLAESLCALSSHARKVCTTAWVEAAPVFMRRNRRRTTRQTHQPDSPP